VLLAAGRPLDGLALCREAIDKDPGSSRLREKSLAILFGLGRDDELYVAASKLLADNPGSPAAHVQLAGMFLRKGLPTLASDHCNKALAGQPGSEGAYRLLVAALLQTGDIEAARERLERLLAVLPQDLDATIKLAECHRRRGDTAKALELLRKGVADHPASPAARSQLAQVLFQTGDGKGAVAEFRETYRLAPNDPTALNNLAAVISYGDGDLSEALGYAEQARKLDPRNPTILDTLAWIQTRLGKHEPALALSELALAQQPNLPILRYHYGAILAALGRQDEVRDALKAAMRGGADFQGVADARALLERLSGAAPLAPAAP
jgi:Flp pilus assembly protein TadD